MADVEQGNGFSSREKKLLIVLCCLAALLFGALGWFYLQTQHLHQELKRSENELTARLQEVHKKVEQEKARQQRIDQDMPVFGVDENLKETLKTLLSGLYLIDLEVPLKQGHGKSHQQKFRLYHFVLPLGESDEASTLHLGFASSGFTAAPKFYMDYNEDGLIDSEMMRDFVYYLPLGRLMAKTLDPNHAQTLYEHFLEYDLEYTASKDPRAP